MKIIQLDNINSKKVNNKYVEMYSYFLSNQCTPHIFPGD